ncbi:Piwi domain-containing protein [Rhizobium sp. L51/94]|uniref:Piwi domain-containing protein n=1 Tax=Rhizobium sp. L51/94 TaxID=2819999 RepID=UPI001C5B0C97|nr:Piwi domain-containing protein [Rhizobium sp. L51/94]QXZ81713.1 hypothetical protein J5274_24730 [Rhizobium sp. L51/94]
MTIETNIYAIDGLSKLSVQYSVFKIVGLTPTHTSYHGNIQTLIDRLSRAMKAPVTTIERNGERHIVIPTDAGQPPIVKLVGAAAILKPTGETIDLDFGHEADGFDSLRQRFLQFVIQSPLRNRSGLWQPKSGQAFFQKTPHETIDGIELFHGSSLRVVPSPAGGWGLCVDTRSKLVRARPLSQRLTAEEVKRFVGRSLVYRFGHQWFEVTLQGVTDIDISERFLPEGDAVVSLLEYLNLKTRKPVPAGLANLDPAGAAIFYRTEGPAAKYAPAGLCHLVEDPHTKDGARLQSKAILPPHVRVNLAEKFISEHLSRLQLGNVILKVSNKPVQSDGQSFDIPQFRFGRNYVLVTGNPASDRNAIRLQDLGRRRSALLDDGRAGFFSQTPLNRQYLVLPTSVANSVGPAFADDLKRTVSQLYPQGGPYEPEIIVYDDLNARRNFVEQARAIKAALAHANAKPGNALVMIHDLSHRASRVADQLEAMIVKDFPIEFDLVASVIHTKTALETYRFAVGKNEPVYEADPAKRNRFNSYLRNVALSKVLLANGKVPFVLNAPTNGHVFVGIDVKHNTAAFSLVADGGSIIHSKTWKSRQKEQLTAEQVEKYLVELIGIEARSFSTPPREIVVHRDGRAFPSEIQGLRNACARLAEQGVISSAFNLTVIEIKKSGPVTLRLFDVASSDGRRRTNNPTVGAWQKLNDNEGFVCTTGEPFGRRGTARPLHVVRVSGDMTIDQCVEDVFKLSCLAWSSPDGGTRLPASIKLCDRVLFEDAADYDVDALNFANPSSDGSVA